MGEPSSALWGVLPSPEGSMGLPGFPTAPAVGAVGTELPLIKLFKASMPQHFLGRAGKRWPLYWDGTSQRAVLPQL